MSKPMDFDQLAKDMNVLLNWARQKITDHEASTGAMSFTGPTEQPAHPFGYNRCQVLREYLKGMGLIRQVRFRGNKPPIWWIQPDITVTSAMVRSEHYRQTAVRTGVTEGQLLERIAELEEELRIVRSEAVSGRTGT